jgi:hypothetical protein
MDLTCRQFPLEITARSWCQPGTPDTQGSSQAYLAPKDYTPYAHGFHSMVGAP